MKFFGVALLTALFATASMAAPQPRQFCSEAARFGIMRVSPTGLVPGSSYTISTDFACGISKGYKPKYLDYYLEVPSGVNNGHQGPILIARKEFDPSQTSLTFTTEIPKYGGFVPGFSNYVVRLQNSFIQNTTDGKEIYLVGGIETSIDLTT